MPSDRFTNLRVYWSRIDHDDGNVCAALKLPLNSIIKNEIIGDPKDNVRHAKQHAAFEACIQLYDNGELNDNLVPVADKQKIEIHNDEYFLHWNAYSTDNEKAGTRNNRRYHQKKTPKVFENSAPEVGKRSFIYRINVKPQFDAPTKELKIYGNLMKNRKEFGILTSKQLPKLCRMKLFQTFGEINVEITCIAAEITLKSQVELNTLQKFHVTIFKDILGTWKNFFLFDETSYLIIPLTESDKINWDLANEFQGLDKPRRLTHEEINATEFSSLAYRYRVVSPVYRDPTQKCVVIDVPENMTPMSPFPNDSFAQPYSSYEEYYFKKFNLIIQKTNQPMIEVKGISSNLNLFFPGTGSGGKQRKHEKKHITEHLIPELCHNYKFPADYWLKATLLPSVMHRMHYMLLAEELRMWLIDEKIDLNYGFQNLILDVDYGNYDERDKKLNDLERQHETYGQFQNVLELKQQSNEAQFSDETEAYHSNSLTLWNGAELPIDVDRNWLTITNSDLQYYSNFVSSNQNHISTTGLDRFQQLNYSRCSPTHFPMDKDDRQEIKIISATSKHGSVQQKDLIKVLTTSNAGMIVRLCKMLQKKLV